jgi:thioredoxin domain-containing protein 5
MNAPHQPLVVIAAVTTETKDIVAEKVRDIGKTWNARGDRHENGNLREVVFTWMDAEKWASWLKSMYGIKAEPGSDPAIIVADHAVCLSLLPCRRKLIEGLSTAIVLL